MIGGVPGRIGLHVNEFDLKRRALNAVIAAFALLLTAGPPKSDLTGSIGLDRGDAVFFNVRRKTLRVLLDQRTQYPTLLTRELIGRNALGRIAGRLCLARGSHFAWRLF